MKAEKELNALAALIEGEAVRVRRQGWFITVLYVTVSALTVGYIFWASGHLKQALNEETTADMVAAHVSVNIMPRAKERIGAYMINTMPQHVDIVLEEMKDGMPYLRQIATDALLASTEEQLNALYGELKVQFDELLELHDAELRTALANLKTEEGKDAFIELMQQLLKEQYQTELASYVNYVTLSAEEHKERMQRLLTTPTEQLPTEERKQKALIMLMLANVTAHSRENGSYNIRSGFVQAIDQMVDSHTEK